MFDIYISYYPKASSSIPPPSSTPISQATTPLSPSSYFYDDDDLDFPSLPSIKTPSSEATPTQSSNKTLRTIFDSELLLLLKGHYLCNWLHMGKDKEFNVFHHGSHLLYTQRGLLETLPLSYSCFSVTTGASVRDDVTSNDTRSDSARVDSLLAAYLNVHKPTKTLGYMFSYKHREQHKSPLSCSFSSTKTPLITLPTSLPSILNTIPESHKELYLCVDSLKPGCLYSTIIDFHHPVALTDLSFQASAHMFSVSVDVWLEEGGLEETHPQRIAQSSNLNTHSLLLGNIQPPVLCRFARINYVGRMNASNEKCAVPLGSFFGLPVFNKTDLSKSSLEYALRTEESQVFSQYIKSREELEDLLSMYSQSPPSHTLKQQMEKQVSTHHASCFGTQAHLARLRHVIHQKCSSPNTGMFSIQAKQELRPSSSQLPLKKLSKLMGCVVDAMLIMVESCLSKATTPDSLKQLGAVVDKEGFKTLFLSQCVHGLRTLHARACALLVFLCGDQPWWGDAVSELFKELFSKDQLILFNKERSVVEPATCTV